MKSLIRHIFLDKSVATMLLISSFIIGICALAPAVYVIIVLNKYLASGVTATLLSLSAGAIMMLIFEFLFRQNRTGMIQKLNQRIFQPMIDALAKKLQTTQITKDQFKSIQRADTIIKAARSSSITGWLLDWPFVLMFLVVLFVINWTAAVITGIFMIVMIGLTMQRINLSIAQDSTANLEIFLTGLLTITVMAIGSVQIIQGELDIGLLIGSNILAARALIGANKYAKAKEAIDRREQATNTIYNFIK